MIRRRFSAAALGVLLTAALSAPQSASAEVTDSGRILAERSIYVAEDVSLNRPVGVGVGESGEFAVTLRDAQKVLLFDEDGDWIRTWGTQGVEPGNLSSPYGVALDTAEGRVYVAERARQRLIAFTTEGEYVWETEVAEPLTPLVSREGILLTTTDSLDRVSAQGQVQGGIGTLGKDPGQFDSPRSAAFVDDSLIVVDTNNTRVQMLRLSANASPTVEWVVGRPPTRRDDPGTFLGEPTGVALDDKGRAYVLDSFRHNIHVIDPASGEEIYRFEDLQGEEDGLFNLPTAIGHLGGNRFVITDTHNNRVQIVRIVLPGEDDGVREYPSPLWLIPVVLLVAAAALIWNRWRVRRREPGEPAG